MYNGTSWVLVGSKGFSNGDSSHHTLAFDSNNSPYLAYRDFSDDGAAIVQRFNGSSWVDLGMAPLNSKPGTNLNLIFDINDIPFLSYSGMSNRVYIRRFNTGIWQYVSGTVGFANSSYLQVKSDLNGIPYVGSLENGTTARPTIKKFNGANWEKIDVSNVNPGRIKSFSFAIGQDNLPIMAYGDINYGQRATVLRYNGSNWSAFGPPGMSDNFITNSGLVVDNQNTPILAYIERNATTGKYEISVRRFNGSTWDYLGAKGFAVSSPSSVPIPIVLDKNEVPYIAYTASENGYKIVVARFDGTQWVNVGDFPNSPSYYPSLAFDSNNELFISYQQGSGIAIRHFDGTNWIPVGNGSSSYSSAMYTSLVFDSNDIPYVGFTTQSFGLKGRPTVLKLEGSDWVSVGQGISKAEFVNSLDMAFDGTNKLIAVYNGSGAYAQTYTIPAPIVTPGVPDLAETSDTGVSNIDNLTNVAMPTFEGDVVAGNEGKVLEIVLNEANALVVYGSGTIESDESYSVKLSSPLSEGSSNIYARINDGGRTGNISDPLSVFVDISLPQITCPEALSSATTDGSAVAITLVDPTATDNESAPENITFEGTRSDGLPLTDPFPLGETSISWTATDEAGNTSEACNQVVTVEQAEGEASLNPDGSVEITDTNGGGLDDAFSFSLNGDNLQIVNTNHPIGITGPGVVQVDANTVEIPVSSITGGITLNGAGGTNTLSLDSLLSLLGPDNTLTLQNLNTQLTGGGSPEYHALNVFDGFFDLGGVNLAVTTLANFFQNTSLIGSGGIVGPLVMNAGSVLSPGNSTGTIATGDLVMEAGSILEMDVNGPTPDTEHDQVIVTGTVTINGATLSLLGGYANVETDEIVLIDNDGTDPISGTFADYAEGDPVIFGAFSGIITYTGGDGNDLALQYADVLPPTILTLTPEDDAVAVDFNQDLVMVFSEPVEAGTGFITIKEDYLGGLTQSVIASSGFVTVVDNTVTFSPELPLSPNQNYVVTIDDDFVRDSEGNAFVGFTDETIWNFASVATADSDPPQVVALSPVNGATDVGLTDNLEISFDEPVFVNVAIAILIRESDTNLLLENLNEANGTALINGSTVTLDPINNFEPNTTYYVTVDYRSFEDASGNDFRSLQIATDWVFTTAADTNPPQITCPEAITVSTDAGVCEAAVTLVDPTATDDISAPENITFTGLRSDGLGLTDPFPAGETTITWTVEDESGKVSDSCDQLITVNDTEAPVAVCQNFTLNLDENGQGSIVAADIDNGSSDNCGVASLALDRESFTTADLGEQTVTLTVTDTAGNANTCTATVTVQDITAPAAVCQDVTLILDENGQATLTAAEVDNGSGDASGIASLAISQENFDCSNLGQANPVTLTVTDTEGNSNTCTANVTVLDQTAPSLTCGAPISQTSPSGQPLVLEVIPPSVLDACDTAPALSGVATLPDNSTFNLNDQTASYTFPVGTSTIVWTTLDASGNPGTCQQLVTVNFTPSSASSITSFTAAGAAATIAGTNITAEVPFGTDLTNLVPNINISEFATIDPVASTPRDFTNPVTYTVTAQDGTSQTTYTVALTVAQDITPPTATVFPESGTQLLPVDQVFTVTFDEIVELTDPDNGVVIFEPLPSGGAISLDFMTVVNGGIQLTNDGNVSTLTLTPTIDLPPNTLMTFEIPSGLFADLSGNPWTGFSGFSLDWYFSTGLGNSDCTSGDIDLEITFDDWPNETSWELRDQGGNLVDSSPDYSGQQVGSTIQDQFSGLADGTYTFTIIDSFGDGICCGQGQGSFTVSKNGIEIFSGGQFQAELSFQFCIDASIDAELPSITCPADIVEDAGTSCSIALSLPDPTATDNVSSSFTFEGIRSDELPLTEPFYLGETTITWTAMDEAGNVSESCTQIVTINGSGDCWSQVGPSFVGAGNEDRLGAGVTINAEGNIAAYVIPNNGANGDTGEVIVLERSGATWNPLGGTVPGGSQGRVSSGIDLNDAGTRLAVSQASWDVNVYELNNGNWQQIGATIPKLDIAFIQKVDFDASGNTLAIGYADGANTGGQVAVYEFVNGQWTLKGSVLTADNLGDFFGRDVSLSGDGSRLAVGAYQIEEFTYGPRPGYARVYEFENGDWATLGNTIVGDGISNNGSDFFGISLGLNADGDVLVVGANAGDYAKVFKLENDTWVQIGNNIGPEFPFHQPGYQVDINGIGNLVLIGDFDQPTRAFQLNQGQWIPFGQPIYEGIGQDVAMNKAGDVIIAGTPESMGFRGKAAIFEYSGPLPDGETPQITCPDALFAGTMDGTPINVTLVDPTATDNETAPENISFEGVRSDALQLTDPFPLGETTITWTATDEAGNTSESCEQLITVFQAEAMAMLGQDGSLLIDDVNGGISDDYFGISSDGENLIIESNTPIFVSGPGTVQIDANTVQIPLSGLTGGLTIDGQGGNDLVVFTTSLSLTGAGNGLFLNNINAQFPGSGPFDFEAIGVTNGDFDTGEQTIGVVSEANFSENATLSGVGGIDGTVNMNTASDLEPGVSPGSLATGNLNMAAGAVFVAEVFGPVPGTDHDQVVVTGAVNLENAELLLLGGYPNAPTDEIILILNDGADPIVGSFAGLAEGDAVNFGDFSGFITYTGGDGNDVSLYSESAPEVLTVLEFRLVDAVNDVELFTISPGMAIDVNELPTNQLNVVAVTTDDVESVFLTIDGAKAGSRTENFAPYALFGDSNGNFFGMQLPLGGYNLNATPYSGNNREGDSGTPLEISFSLVEGTSGPDETPPLITLLGANPQPIVLNDAYVELGATALDNIDGDISDRITIDASAVNTAIAGDYPVTYNVSDDAGNDAIERIRTVRVVEENEPAGPLQVLDARDDSFLFNLTEGLVINKAEIGDIPLGVIFNADLNPGGVRFVLSGPLNQNRFEGPEPHSLFGDIGVDIQGRLFPDGEYTLLADPVNGSTVTVSFTVVSQDPNCPVVTLAAFEPIQDTDVPFTLSGGLPEGGNYSIDGVPATVFDPSMGAGTYEITYSYSDGADCSGTASRSLQVLSDEVLSITGFELIFAEDNSVIAQIEDGSEIDVSGYPVQNFNIRAIATGDTESVRLVLSGSLSTVRTENVVPYAVYGDINGNYSNKVFPLGPYSLTATAYSANNLGGESGAATSISFSLVNAATSAKLSINSVKLFPNPAAETLYLSFMESTRVLEIRIFDATGKLVKVNSGLDSFETKRHEIQVGSLTSGSYFMHVYDNQGRVYYKKLLIDRK